MPTRTSVLKTYKMWVNGQFIRSESGRTYEVRTVQGDFLANVPQASRKDLRDSIEGVQKAQPSWAQRTAYNRGQILYRVAEMLESRRDALSTELTQAIASPHADAEIDRAIDLWVHYAGWSDKWSALLSTLNPVAMPMHNFTLPEPMGVVGLVCPESAPLASLSALIAPIIVSGNTVVALLPENAPTVGLAFAEVLATSDLPGGVVQLLSGRHSELLPHLCGHTAVDALDLCGVPDDQRASYEVQASESVKRVAHSPNPTPDFWLSERAQGLDWIERFVEFKTVWHPIGW